MDADQVLAFRLEQSGLAERTARAPAEAVGCPASDFVRDSALLAIAARSEIVDPGAYRAAVDDGELVVAHIVRGAIHVLAPGDFGLYGPALVAEDEPELAAQLGRQVTGLSKAHGIAVTDALSEVTAATADALSGGRRLDKNTLHEELRQRVRPELMPWCQGCRNQDVAPMLWRYAAVKAGVRLDAERRYVVARPAVASDPSEAVRRFLRYYGPATPAEFGEWAGLARTHARRLWDRTAAELVEVHLDRTRAWMCAADEAALHSPATARGLRLLPPGDPYLMKPNRRLLAPDAELRKRLFRPVASPGAVLHNGRLAALWRAKIGKASRLEITLEKFMPLPRDELEREAARVAELRRASAAWLSEPAGA
jgi:hypothetical protein